MSTNDPWVHPPQNVPATAQQILPPHLPELIPSNDGSAAAGQTPYSAMFTPPCSRPHIMTSQQFSLLLSGLLLSGSLSMVLTPALCLWQAESTKIGLNFSLTARSKIASTAAIWTMDSLLVQSYGINLFHWDNTILNITYTTS